MGRAVVVSVGCAAALVGCSLVLSPGELSGGDGDDGGAAALGDATARDAPASPPDSADDAAPTTDGGGGGNDASNVDAAADAPPNLLVGGDFETASSTDCMNGVAAYQGTSGSSTVAHGGALSCRACWNGTGGFYTLDGFDVDAPVVGATYHGQAWVRAPAATTTSSQSLVAYFRTYVGSLQLQAQAGAAVQLTDQWQLVQVTWQVPGPADRLNMYIANESPSIGDCFLADDVAIDQEP